MKRSLLFIFIMCSIFADAMPQVVHKIKGTVIERNSRKPLEFINVLIVGTGRGTITDAQGHFTIESVAPGIYQLQASALGYKTILTPEYIVSVQTLNVDIEIEENSTELNGVVVVAPPFKRNVGAPLGLRSIGVQEIEKSPGANRDISRIVQSYPGVGFSPAGYRNDLVVRGGGPSENRFFLDGVEIPNINHFSTQGASGGPVGIINADLIREVNFYTSAFPANMGNSLSSVLDFKLQDGNMERNSIKATLGASEVSLASNGHLGKKTSYLVSVRQSYLQFLFDLLKLPLLPTFTDAQFKIKTRFDAKNELTVIGLTGIDNMRLNTKLEGEKAEYILSYLPKIQQETFTVGAVYRHYAGANVQTLVASHSWMRNRNTKYKNNQEDLSENLILKLNSIEQESKLRFENATTLGSWKINAGINLNYSQYTNTSFQKVYLENKPKTFDYQTNLDMMHWSVFGTVSYVSPNERFTSSLSLRADANNYSSLMNRLYNQLSPRLSLSYRLTKQLYVSGSAGIYYQHPSYTALGFKENTGLFVNNQLRYMSVNQGSLGLKWYNKTLEFSVEGFYKQYDKVPFSVEDGIPLACKGNDYGVIGNEQLISSAQGRAYGLEVMARWIIAGKLNMASSFTLFRSEYRKDKDNPYIASAWDNRYILNLSGTYNFPRNWSVGLKVKAIGGAPYTPYDLEKSSLKSAWDVQGRPYYDYKLYNTVRLPNFGQLDFRLDKTFYLKRCMLGFYIDLQNITNSTFKQPDILMSTGVIENPGAAPFEQRYKMKYIEQKSGTILPTLGITFQY